MKGAAATIPKVKEKTRPPEHSASTEVDETTDQIEDLLLTEGPGRRTLSRKDSLPVFQRMFTRTNTKHGPTKWPQFVAALQDAGLVGTFNGGSMVMFSDELTHKGAVTFHKNHPNSDIPLNMLRDMGVSLTRWFGWNEDTFFLRSKEDK